MALGPKEMTQAIIANLKDKTGKDKNEWLNIIASSGLEKKKELKIFMKEQGLGAFQANAVVELYLDDCSYNEPEKLIDNLFVKHPEQKILMNSIIMAVAEPFSLTVKPCKGYIPLYGSDRKISLSFKPTSKGLYVGLIGDSFLFDTIPHKASYGGSQRMRFGFLAKTEEQSIKNIRSYLRNLD
ncbi:DUF4287 domain-containing protein [Vibrio fortis]|uniref:DUF4287 domain-containing protein n=1 Tax=Vibrio fortis TaxID=212667 RepID=UPI0038CD41B5